MIIEFLLDNWVTDQLKTGETREQEVRESGERQRKKREGKKERKEKQRFRDKENSFRVINKRTFFFFFFTKETDFHLRFLCLSTKPIRPYWLNVMFLASWTWEVIYKVNLITYWLILSAGKMNQNVQVSERNYDKPKDQINWFAASSINVLFKMMIMHQ